MSDLGQRTFAELWVCFTPPPENLPPDVLVISFMVPSAEADASERWGARLVSGRELIAEVRARARAEYVSLIARLGSTAWGDEPTLRQMLQGPGGYSRWWFLGPTEKDCVWDGDQTYITLLRLMAVRRAQDGYSIDRIRFHGASPAFVAALGQPAGRSRGSVAAVVRAVARGLIARLALAYELCGVCRTLRQLPRPSVKPPEVLLQGYWDWSVRSNGHGDLRDRYFTDLPSQLARRGLSVGWLASCEPHLEPWQGGRKRRDVLAGSCAHPEVTLLERYLAPADIVRAACNLRYPVQTTRFVLDRRFRSLCRVGTLDLYPVVREQLLRAAWGSTCCRLELIAMATARACRELRPRMVLTFMELFLRARAIYAGVSASSTGAISWAAQHAGYSSDKTLGAFDPEIEMRGMPDGCAVPAPDGIFVMGELSRRIWQATGLSSTRVIATGGLRYQSVQIRPARRESPSRQSVAILLACGMNEGAELELCDAALAAVAGLPAVNLYWRDHPNYQFSRRKAFRSFRGRITVTSRTLDEDLENADLVLFTHAGIAEEALLLGIPTWQWLWAGFNTSPFLDVPVIPSFTSVTALRRELQAFMRDPTPYQPKGETQHRVLHESFGPDPAGASARIADAIQHMIAADVRAHA